MDESQAALINDKNCCIVVLQTRSEKEQVEKQVMETTKNNEQHDENDKFAKRHPLLKHAYRDDQWSPLNLSGKRVYDREFLIELCNDPNSYVEPLNLPDVTIVLKHDIVKLKNRNLKILENLNNVEQYENEELDQNDTTPKGLPPLKYTHRSDQWSLLNMSGKKFYDQEFFIELQSDPNSKIKPLNPPDLEVILKDNSRNNRGSMNLGPFKEVSIEKFNPFLFPVSGFVQSSQSALGVLPPRRGSQKGKPKSDNLVVIRGSCSAKEDIKLRRSENPWIPSRLESDLNSQDNNPIDGLYKTVRRVLNKMMPENFNKLLNQVTALRIESEEELQGVVNLVFDKAVDEPRFVALYALMCKQLAMKRVSGPNSKAEKEERNVNFRKLIITRCQMVFEEDFVDKNARAIKMQEIEACADPEKKKELQHILTEEERKIRVKSVGNIRFIGELFKQGMLTTNIMHRCIRHLLTQTDEKSLECLCKLLSTIGKDLESKSQNLDQYFKQMLDIVNRKGSGKVSSRVRFMLQDVIELRLNRWIPRRDDSRIRNGKDMDNLKLGNRNMFQWSRNVSLNAPETLMPNKFTMLYNLPCKQDRRSGLQLSGWRSTGPRHLSRSDYKSSYDGSNSQNIPNKPTAIMTEEQLAKEAANILQEYLSDTNIDVLESLACDNMQHLPISLWSQYHEYKFQTFRILLALSRLNAALEVRETFDNSTFVNFVRETMNGVVEKSVTARKQVSQLMTHLISKNILPMSLYLVGLAEVMDMAEDLLIDIPKIWVYLAELICYPLAEGVVPFSELKTTMAPLKNKGLAGKLIGELMIMLVQEKGPKWIKDKWDQAGLEWSDFLREDESLNDFIKKYKLEFLVGDSNSDFGSLSGQLKLSMEQIHERLLSLVSNEKENSFDNICSWISANVGERASEPQFIRVLTTAILEVSIEPYNNTFKFRSDKFHNLQTLISRYIDVNEVLEIQCLIAIQEHIHKLEHPSGVLLQIIEKLWDDSILSTDAFLVWESNKDPTAITGKSVAVMTLASFFTSLKERDDESSGEEA